MNTSSSSSPARKLTLRFGRGLPPAPSSPLASVSESALSEVALSGVVGHEEEAEEGVCGREQEGDLRQLFLMQEARRGRTSFSGDGRREDVEEAAESESDDILLLPVSVR
jgi:hypothetical protein